MAIEVERKTGGPSADAVEQARLAKLFDRRRDKLLDMRLSNPMLNYKHSYASNRQLRIVDEVPEDVYRLLAIDERVADILPLPEPGNIPADERTEEFSAALGHAKVSDVVFRNRITALGKEGRDDEYALAEAEAETELRARLRDKLGLPPRPNRKTINPSEHAKSLGIDPALELRANADRNKSKELKLQTLRWPDSLEAVLGKIADGARLAEQEMGLSTLFLAFGFLEWADSKDTSKGLFAPLLLLPVRLASRKTGHGKLVFTLTANASAADDNLSLRKKLSIDFGLILPSFNPDESTRNPVEDYFTAINALVDEQPGWRVRRCITLGHFAFGRLAMYADLDPANWTAHPTLNALVGAIIRGTEIIGDGGAGLSAPPPDYEVDLPEIETLAPYLVQDADASQHSAIVDIMAGKNLVIQGPPGTGKSQTIANVIANALAAGKKVLFLAEKMAALEVVKRRLDAADLGHFCLELHSDKSSPKQVIDSLKLRHKLGYQPSRERQQFDTNWHEARRNIHDYLQALHSDTDVGKPFDQFWRAIRVRGEHGELVQKFRRTPIPEDIMESTASYEAALGKLIQYSQVRAEFDKAFGKPEDSVWARLRIGPGANSGMAYGLVDSLETLKQSVRTLIQELNSASQLGWATTADVETAQKIDRLLPLAVPSDEWISALAVENPARVRAFALKVDKAARVATERKSIVGLDLPDQALHGVAIAVIKALPPEQHHQKPAETYGEARRVVEAVGLLREAINSGRPSLMALGLGERFPAAGITAVRLLAVLVEGTPLPIRELALGTLHVDAEVVATVRSEWRKMAVAESSWRARFPGARRPWPAPEALRAAQTVRGKTGLGGLLSSLGANAKIVAEINQSLGLPTTLKLPPDDYGQLARHSQKMAAFNENPAHQQLFGDLWRGLDTPLEAIELSQCQYRQLRDELTDLAGGEEVLNLVQAARPEKFYAIAAALEPLALWSNLDLATREFVGERSLGDLEPFFRGAEARALWLLDADPRGNLAAVDATWIDIGRAIAKDEQSLVLHAEIARDGLWPLATRLRDSPEMAKVTLDWLDAVDKAPANAELRSRLRSNRAESTRSQISATTPRLRDAMSRVTSDIARIELEFRVSGFSVEAVPDLWTLVDALSDRRDELAQLLSLRSARAGIDARGLAAFLAQADKLDIPANALSGLFSGLVAQMRGERVRRDDPVLSIASGVQLHASRADFGARDKRKMERDKKLVFNKIISNGPVAGSNYGPKGTWTEDAALNDEFRKEGAFRKVRELISSAAVSIQSMKPCLMMSPMSLAKFVPAGSLVFDILVIDEASQMRPEDALGALLRAKQVVVVGDPKQLPPSDFFQRSANDAVPDDELEEDDTDDESILEACHKAFRQLRLLRWHYRSRCESLIAFSNREIYAPEGRELITFPAARTGSFSIDRIRVQGEYVPKRGNAPEAQRMAEVAVRFMREHSGLEEPPTIGLVAMNSAQAELIGEELRLRMAGDVEVERYKKSVDKRGEPLFVKNLENVQGDERDFILISMTYGPKPGQKSLLQRFGPINFKQGHRRLNVLFTRARMRIGLVTSMDSSDVRPLETSSRGVHLLKKYLHYVESRGQEGGRVTGREPDSDFEIHVASGLRSRGYHTAYQVGVSGFRIDLAVIDPRRQGHFLAGIECDGAQYHSSKSARDRDRLRQEVLEGLGWTILRVWSTDWFDNADRQMDILDKRLQELLSPGAPRTAPYVFDRDIAANIDVDVATDIPTDFEAASISRTSSTPTFQPLLIEEEPAGVTNPDGGPTAGDEFGSFGLAKIADSKDGEPLYEPWKRDNFTPAEARVALAAFRKAKIGPSIENWEPERSILRAGLIEALVEQRVVDDQDWFSKVPTYLRRNTNGIEKRKFFGEICDIVARVEQQPKVVAPRVVAATEGALSLLLTPD